MSIRAAAAILFAALSCLLLPAAAFAQARQWQVVTQTGGYSIARVVSPGLASGVALTCERGLPVIAVNLARAPARSPAAVVLQVDGVTFPVALLRNGSTNVWVAGVRDRRLIDAMAGGSAMQVSVAGAAYGSIPLTGAHAAISNALARCHRVAAAPPRPAPPPSTSPLSASPASAFPNAVEPGANCPSLAPVERWGKANAPSYMGADIVFCGDFNGDGTADALAFVLFEMGNSAGQHVALFQNTAGTLRFLRRVPDLYGEGKKASFARGKILVETSAMQPGDARCCPSGKAYAEIDVATGRHVNVAAPRSGSPAAVPPRPAPPASPANGPLNRIPMLLGYYVNVGETCRRPGTVTKFEPDGFWIIDAEGAFKEKVARVTLAQGAYILVFASAGKPDPNEVDDAPSEAMIVPRTRGRVQMTINGDAELQHCSETEIPARLRR